MVQISVNAGESEKPASNRADEQSPTGEQADLQAASKATADYSHLMPQLKPKKKWPRVVGWILLALIVLGGLGGAYWFVNRPAAKPKPAAVQQKSSSKKPAQTVGTQQYNSANLNLTLSYPNGWTVADTGDGRLTVTSTPMQLTDADGQTQTGQEILYIAKQASADLSAFAHGNAEAVLASQLVSYAQPTPTQQANAYISFLQYSTTTTKGGLDGIYVTGNFGYAYAQQVPESDITKIDPLIRVTFTKCAETKCGATTTPLTISSDMWKSASFSAPILAMFKSLQLS